jgi:CDP-diacylglycerol--serine O-phosphatidyltransferase
MAGENSLASGNSRKLLPRSMKRKRIKKTQVSALTRISFLPSVFTMLNLFLGYKALLHILGPKHNFKTAIYYITASVIMDGFDGTIARLTKTESNFGVQLDSLVDAVSFGLVTSILTFEWGFQGGYVQAGSIVAFVFLSAGLIRLARFNVYKEAQVMPANTFIGLPIPIAALAVGSVVLALDARHPQTGLGILLFALYVILISLLMISNIHYRTVKKIVLKNSLKFLFLLALIVACLIIFPDTTIPILTFCYLLSPIFFFLLRRIRKSAAVLPNSKTEVPQETKGGA